MMERLERKRTKKTKMMEDINKMILELHMQGMSIRNIAKSLGISKSNVHRTVSEQGNVSQDSTVPMSQKACPNKEWDNKDYDLTNKNTINNYKTNTSMDTQDLKEIELTRLELEHELQMKKLEMQEEELRLRKLEIESRSKGDTVHLERQKQEERLLVWELSEFFKTELSECDKFGKNTISIEDAEEKLEVVNEHLNKLKKHCVKYQIIPESLAFFRALVFVNDLIKQEVDEFDEDEYDYDDYEIEYIYEFSSREKMKQLVKSGIKLTYDFVN